MAKLVICLNLVLASMVLPARAQVLEGLVQLDKTSFDKIGSKFEYSLIKFDIGYPTGDKHKNFGKVATQVNNFNLNFARLSERMPQSGLGSMQGSTEGCLPLKVVFRPRSSSTQGCLPLNVVFHRRLSSAEGCLVLKVVFHPKLSSTEGRLPPKGVFHRWSSSTNHNSQHTKSQPPTLLRSGLNIFF